MLGIGLNLVKLLFIFLIFTMVLVGALINTIEHKLPLFITRSFRYGKFSYKGKSGGRFDLPTIEVPKAWFKHFYIFSSLLTTFTLILISITYVFNFSIPLLIRMLFDTISSRTSETEVTAAATILALFLLTLQCYRRYYDTHYVSIFGAHSQMNIVHYFVGFLHYAGAVAAIIIEAPNFSLVTNKIYYFRWNDFNQVDIAATFLFFFAWYNQHKISVMLANLRRNEEGRIVSHGHFMPEGHWFKYVSSPHSLAEILMYISLAIILRKNTTWLFVTGWVMSNQIETALLSHWWYKDTFKKYPKERKAIIPYIL